MGRSGDGKRNILWGWPNKIKIGSLKSTGSAKRSFKIERIKLTLSGMAMRNKRRMFKNIDVRRAKEAFVVQD